MSLDRNWRESMREAASRLAHVGVENAPREARLLLALAMGVEPVDVIGREREAVEPAALAAYEAMIQRRLAREPLSRIRGWREFYGRRFIVTPDVLDPRPETELLVEHGLKRLAREGRVLDLGVGSGCILVSVLGEREDAAGVGLDISPAALAVAQRNAHTHGVAARASFLEGGWLDDPGGRFDLALSNPPYIAQSEMAELAEDVRAFDPTIALTPGGDGLLPYRAILSAMPAWLKPGGWIGFEFGASQAARVADLMAAADLEAIAIFADLAGIARAAFGRRPVHGA
jgi:release factor glutamine methyltransferase